jgi:hypothetical protein
MNRYFKLKIMIKTKINNFLYKIRNLEPTTPEGTIRILI